MKLAELYVEITGRDGGLNRTLAQVRSNLLGFAGGVGGIRVNLGAMFYGLAGAAAAMGYVGKKAVDLESALAQIRKTSGLSAEELVQLRARLESLATTMAGVSLSDVLGVAAMAGSLGVQGVDGIAEFTKAISMIKIALDDVPAEEAATSIARILNVFHLGTDSALSFGSALNKLADTSTATGRDILDVTQRLSGAASVMGLSPQKVMALAAALKDAGAENEVAGTAVGQVFMKMATDVEGFAKVAGVSMDEFSAAMKGDPLDALNLLIGGLKRLSTQEQFKALDGLKLDGQRTAQTLLQLGSTIGRVDGYTRTANGEWKTQASILAEVAIKGETSAAQMTLLGNQFTLAAAALGETFLPVLKQTTGELGMVAAAARDGAGDFRSQFTPAVDAFSSAVTTAGVAFRNFEDVVALSGANIAVKLAEMKAALVAFADKAGEVAMDNIPGMGIARAVGVPGFGAVKAMAGVGQEKGNPELDALKQVVKQIEDRIAARETKLIDDRKRADDAAKNVQPKVPRGPNGEAAGTGVAPEDEDETKARKPTSHDPGGKREQGAFSDPAAFARSIQEGLFGKDLKGLSGQQLQVQKDILKAQLDLLAQGKQQKNEFMGVGA